MPLHRGTNTESRRISDVVKWETESRFCREVQEVNIAAADVDDMVVGEALEWDVGASAWVKVVDVTAAGNVVAILLSPLAADADPAVAVAEDRLVLVRGPAVVDRRHITYNTPAEENDFITALALVNIIVRTGPDYDTLART